MAYPTIDKKLHEGLKECRSHVFTCSDADFRINRFENEEKITYVFIGT